MIAMRVPLTAAERKRFTTAQAEAAFAGIEIRLIDGDDGRALFIVTADSTAMTRSFTDFNALEAWLDRGAETTE